MTTLFLPRIAAFLLFAFSAGAASPAGAAQLTDVETRWLTAGAGVLDYAKNELKLPLDISVQPQAGPDDVPLALGFLNGRCKLVLSMRGNPDAENIVASLPVAQRALMIETMTAHEIGHCWRYVQGIWHVLPAGFEESRQRNASPELLRAAEALRETRREEGFADLVALAWIQRRHPDRYAEVAAWLARVRRPLAAEGTAGSHDTQAWLALAPTGDAFSAGLPLFEQASSLWRKGLAQGQTR